MKSSYSNNLLLTGVDDTDGLVLAGSADEAAVTVPGHVVNDIRMHVLQGDHGLACAHVPDDDLVVTTWQQKEVFPVIQCFVFEAAVIMIIYYDLKISVSIEFQHVFESSL